MTSEEAGATDKAAAVAAFQKAIAAYSHLPQVGKPLTRRQLQCLIYTANGYSSAQTGTRTGLSQYTVKQHLKRAYIKLGACNAAQATLIAKTLGIIKDTDVELPRELTQALRRRAQQYERRRQRGTE